MDGIGGEISSKIRAAIKAKLMEMGAYVDEELPDYVMVMVANKRSKAQMSEDLQLFLGKSTELFTNWLQQVLNKLQEVATVNTKALTDTKKVQSRTASSDEAVHKAKSTSKLKSEQVTKPKPEHTSDRTSHRSEKKTSSAVNGGSGSGATTAKKDRRNSGGGSTSEKTKRAGDAKAPKTGSSKTKIVLMNSDDDDDDEDFINIKADAEAEALLKAELPASAKQLKTVPVVAGVVAAQKPSGLPSEVASTAERAKAKPQPVTTTAPPATNTVSARDVTAALAHSTSGARKIQPTVRRVVTAPASVVAVATKRPASGEEAGGPAKRAAVSVGEEGATRKTLASAVAVTDRLGVRPSAGPSIKDRLGARSAGNATAPAPATPSRLASRLGTRNPAVAEASESGPGAGIGVTGTKVTDRLGARLADDRAATVGKVTDRLGARPSDDRTANVGKVADRLGAKPSDDRAANVGKVTDRLGVRLSDDRAANVSKVTDRLGTRPSEDRVANIADRLGARATTVGTETAGLQSRVRVADRLGARRGDATREVGVSRKRAADGGESGGGSPEVVVKRPATEGLGSRLAQRLRELAEGAPGGSGARVAHVPPNNIRQGGAVHADRRPAVNSRVVPTARESASNRDGEDEVTPAVAVPSVVRVTPRPRLPASMQANKNLLLKAVAEAQRSVAAAAATAAATASNTVSVTDSLGAARARERGRLARGHQAAAHRQQEEEGGQEVLQEEEPQVYENNRDEAAENPEGLFTRAFLNRENFAVTVSNETGDSSSEREDDEMVSIPPQSAVAKDTARGYDERLVFEDEDEEEEEGPVTTVAAVRPTVVTTVPHMDTEPVARPNPQFVVTLDGLDISMFPNACTDDDEGVADTGCAVDRDVSKADSGGGGTGPSAAAPSTGRATVVQRVEPRLRLGPMPSHQQQQLQHANELSAAGLSSSSGVTPAKTMERCKYWPACRMGDKCSFHHPTQTCRAFPACKFGEKCLYIHPNCKFDAACTRRDCPYTHSSPRLSAAAAAVPARGLPLSGSGTTVCRFFPSCTNPACRFLHPKACKYGRYCVKPGCTFQHDGVPTTDKLKWVCPFRA